MQDLRTLYQMVKPVTGATHRERVESFYAGQAKTYDEFRKKLLFGRENLFNKLHSLKQGGIWVDMGAGTGSSLDFLSDAKLAEYDKVYLVDLSPSLLEQAEKKIKKRQLRHVHCVLEDVCRFDPGFPVDVVSFSYSLTMLPQWRQTLNASMALLKPQGLIGVVDFYVAEKYPRLGLKTHSSFQRHFWRTWFSHDNVFLNPDHLPYLLDHFSLVELFEGESPIPYLPAAKVPFFSFIGSKTK